jgi:hypothetical protein
VVDADMPETGTIFRMVTTKPNTADDVFEFTTSPPTVYTATKGDVNLDQLVNISDVVTLINHILQTDTLTGEQEYTADFNYDLRLNVSDVVGIINQILGTYARMLASEIDAQSATIGFAERALLSQGKVRVPLSLSADGTIAAIQLNVAYDENSLVPIAPDLGPDWSGIQVLYNSSKAGEVVYLFYSLNGSPIPVNNPPVLQFNNFSGTNELTSNIELVDAVLASGSGRSIKLEYENQFAKISPVPDIYALHPNYPNPFNPITNISYDIPFESRVTIHIYNILGQQVTTLVDLDQAPGRYRVLWHGKNDNGEKLSSGVYIISFHANEYARKQKVMLIK